MSTITQAAHPPRSRARRVVARLTLALAALLLVAYLGISCVAAFVLTTPQRVVGPETPAAFELGFSDVAFPARGGDVQIAAWYIPQAGSQRAVVLVHGKDASRTVWLENGYAPLLQALHGRGFALLMLDMRGHGRSGDARYSFGLNERRDVLGAVDWLEAQGFSAGSIGVYGLSMGAASSIGAVAEEPAIAALVEDCGYAAIGPIIEQEWQSQSHLPQFFLPSTMLAGQLFFGYNIATARPVEEIDDIAPRPVLIIHGTADRLIPVENADELQAAYPSAELWKVEGAGHGGSFDADPAAYVERVSAFFDQHVP